MDLKQNPQNKQSLKSADDQFDPEQPKLSSDLNGLKVTDDDLNVDDDYDFGMDHNIKDDAIPFPHKLPRTDQ